MSAEAPRRPGRPRSADADRAILGAALALAAEVGLNRLTIEGIAQRARVGKATIYRRWDSKEELFADAVRSIMPDLTVPEDSGSFRGDWGRLVGADLDVLEPRTVRILPRLMSEAAEDPELYRVMYDRMVAPRRAIAVELIRRGIGRGELRADLDPELVVDLLIGPIIYRAIISGSSTDAVHGMSERVLDAVLPGLSAPGGAGGARRRRAA